MGRLSSGSFRERFSGEMVELWALQLRTRPFTVQQGQKPLYAHF
jgi:hypothetical protein